MAMKCLPESQHHRTAEAGRHFWRLSCPIPLLKLGSPTSGFSGLCPTKFWTSLRMESLRETCSSVRPPSMWERFLYLNKISLISFFFSPLPFIFPLDTAKSGSLFCTHCYQLFVPIDEIPIEPSLLQAELSHTSEWITFLWTRNNVKMSILKNVNLMTKLVQWLP